MAGKGDKRRPRQISREEYEDRWEKAFGKEVEEASPFQKVAREWTGVNVHRDFDKGIGR